MASNKNIQDIMQKIIEGAPPEKFNVEHLKAIGFGVSNDRAVVPLLKDLDFLTADGTPTARYKDYRDKSRSRNIMAQAIKEKYSDLFTISENISESHRDAIIGRFKSVNSVTDDIASRMAATFFTLLKLADLNSNEVKAKPADVDDKTRPAGRDEGSNEQNKTSKNIQLAYNIQIQLPATKDIEIYNAIFKSIKNNIMGD